MITYEAYGDEYIECANCDATIHDKYDAWTDGYYYFCSFECLWAVNDPSVQTLKEFIMSDGELQISFADWLAEQFENEHGAVKGD